jgi:hypothetical protein
MSTCGISTISLALLCDEVLEWQVIGSAKGWRSKGQHVRLDVASSGVSVVITYNTEGESLS